MNQYNLSQQQATRRSRSPAAPSRPILGCFDDANKLLARYTHGTFTKGEIASTIGISANSGPFGQRFFSIKEYALIEGSDHVYRVSPLFLDMRGSGAGSPKFRKLAFDAVKRASVFADLLEQFPNKIPDIKTLAMRLETHKKFNPERAKSIAAVLQDSLSSVGILDSSGNVLLIRDPKSPVGSRGGPEDAVDEGGTDTEAAKSFRLDIPLSAGRKATVTLPAGWSVGDAKKIGRVLVAAAEE